VGTSLIWALRGRLIIRIPSLKMTPFQNFTSFLVTTLNIEMDDCFSFDFSKVN
jgi:hypothetical protein